MTVQEYLNENTSAFKEIKAINTVFEPFGLSIDEVIKGAQIVRYKIKLPYDVKAQGKIRRAEKDIEYTLSTALQTNDIIYGKESDFVYVEKKSTFEPVMFEDSIFNLPDKGLYLLLGKDLDGKNTYTNLSKAPHILVGGTTGSGKSELLHAFIASLIMRREKNPCQLILIDPKRAEFSVYKNRNGIDLITDMSEASKKLSWAVDLMEERYKTLEQNKCKDIYELNDPNMYPYVIIVDELADLMMQERDAEKYIIRLAQKARACGIHLILGTQSPRRDVITGLIKSNIPTKIALHTTSQMESRIILDKGGAEKLFGKGDMLYLGNGAFNPIRIQSSYISQEMKEKIANALSYEEHKEAAFQKTDITSDELKANIKAETGWDFDNAVARYKVSDAPIKKKKKVGLLKALLSVKPIMFRTDDYPPKI